MTFAFGAALGLGAGGCDDGEATVDAGRADAGVIIDGGAASDAGGREDDAGARPDATAGGDAGRDAGSAVDGGAASDAGVDAGGVAPPYGAPPES